MFHRRNRKPWLVTLRLDDVESFVSTMQTILVARDTVVEAVVETLPLEEPQPAPVKARTRAKPKARIAE